ncbi:MAG: hypothetical protein ACO2ZM_00415 [Francisellaceae bacterium]
MSKLHDISADELSKILQQLAPFERLKYLRKKQVKQTQDVFCKEGIVRVGTLKATEAGKVKIGERVADKLVNKFAIEGIIISPSLFLDEHDPCHIQLNAKQKKLCNDPSQVEYLRNRLDTLCPISIESNDYSPFLKKGSLILGHKINKSQIQTLKNTLCLIEGNKQTIYYLSHNANNATINAEIKGKKSFLPVDIFDLCNIYVIDVVYYPENAKE